MSILKIVFFIWLALAGIPEPLHEDFYNVAICESKLDHDAVGDGGLAKGVMQVHFDFWQDWALTISPKYANLDWNNPVDNLRLTYLIQEKYSLPRQQDRWEQWTAKPYFNCD